MRTDLEDLLLLEVDVVDLAFDAGDHEADVLEVKVLEALEELLEELGEGRHELRRLGLHMERQPRLIRIVQPAREPWLVHNTHGTHGTHDTRSEWRRNSDVPDHGGVGFLADHGVDGRDAVLEGREEDAVEFLLGRNLVHPHHRLRDHAHHAWTPGGKKKNNNELILKINKEK
jgi:hypothetical protein